MNAFRRWLYILASLIGDVNAISRGPTAIFKRLVRKFLWKNMGKTINKVMK